MMPAPTRRPLAAPRRPLAVLVAVAAIVAAGGDRAAAAAGAAPQDPGDAARARELIGLARAAIESWPADDAAWLAAHRELLLSPALTVPVVDAAEPVRDRAARLFAQAEECREWLVVSALDARSADDPAAAREFAASYLRGRPGPGTGYRLGIVVTLAELDRAQLRTAGVLDLLAGRLPLATDPVHYRAHWHVTAGRACLDLGQLGQARAAVDEARAILDATPAPDDPYWTHADCAQREAELDVTFLGDAAPDEAVALAAEYVANYPDGETGAVARMFHALARLLAGTDLDAVEAELDALFDEVPSAYRLVLAEKCADAALRAGRYAAARRHVDRALAFARELGLGDRSRAALYTAEIALADPASDAAVRAAALGDLEVLCARLLAAWRALPDVPNGVGFLRDDRNARAFGALAALLLRVDPESGVRRALDWLWRAEACSVLARADDVAVPDLAAVQRSLAEVGATLVAWLPGRAATLAFVIDANAVQVVTAAGLREIRGPLLALDRALRRVAASDVPADAQVLAERDALATALGLDAVLAAVGPAARIVVNAPTLEWLPFELFADPAVPDRWLGETRTIEHVASLPLAIAEAGARVDSAGPALLAVATLGGADMLGGPGSRPLPPEAVLGARIPTGVDARLLLGAAATRTALLDGLATDPPRGLVILHGERPPLGPPGLLIAGEAGESELFDTSALGGLQLSGDYAILACRSARGAPRIGDGPLADTFPGALLRARANSVAAPRTDLWADRAVEFATALLDAWCAGVDLATAVRAARAAPPDAAARLRWACIQVHGRSWARPARADDPEAVAAARAARSGERWVWLALAGLGSLAVLSVRSRSAARPGPR